MVFLIETILSLYGFLEVAHVIQMRVCAVYDTLQTAHPHPEIEWLNLCIRLNNE